MIRPRREAFNACLGTMVVKVAMYGDEWLVESLTE